MLGKIFINYRREDSTGTAGRLHDRIAQMGATDETARHRIESTVRMTSLRSKFRRRLPTTSVSSPFSLMGRTCRR
jgi:hypothetical protein